MAVLIVPRSAVLAGALALLGGCVSEPVSGPVPFHDNTPRSYTDKPQTLASFACGGALPAVHQQICASEALSRLDHQVVDQYRQKLRELDVPGGLLLEANQRRWMLSRAGQCGLTEEARAEAANPQAIACLESMYRKRARQLADWAVPAPQTQKEAHAWSSYAEYRLVDSRGQGMCEAIGAALNRELKRDGIPRPDALPNVQVLAGSHAGSQQTKVGASDISVNLYDAGLYAGYERRARGVSVDGVPVLDHRTLPLWVAEQPNYGGRAHASSSQTGDYASIDVLERNGQTLVLVNESWGFYSPAARGESAYAGLYRLQGKQLEPLCLYQTYLTPPRTNTLAGLPAYQALQTELDTLAGDPLAEYAQHERRDNFQTWKEQQWTLLNLPLVGAEALSRYGRKAALQQRNDEVLEAFFGWSERNLRNKQIYRKVLPMMQPAYQELQQMFRDQGLETAQATAAADLLFHASLARSMDNLAAPQTVPDMPLAAFARYQPRYAIAPQTGELEQGRNFATLHSVLLNNAPLRVVSDFIEYETAEMGGQRGRGPDGNSATMAAVGNPEALTLLLRHGFDPNQSNDWGKTALMSAVQLDRPDSVKLLFEHGADVHRQTRRQTGAGAGGPDRTEATTGKQTALTLAAQHASGRIIDQLIAAGATRMEWAGYKDQVCGLLAQNRQLDGAQRSRVQGPLCIADYAPAPATLQARADLRRGEEISISEAGQDYRVKLIDRPAMTLFGQAVEMHPQRLRKDLGKMARAIGTAAVRRGKGEIKGPLTLVFNDLTESNAEKLKAGVAFPVSAGTTSAWRYQVEQKPASKALRIVAHDPDADPGTLWHALFTAAERNNLTPTMEGYMLIHTRGTRSTEYQLGVIDQPRN
ncbi:ankyrin repeat domain-containing protein [Pseudomonas sp. OIL-1]|uniref:ankyrin repeat domain-containing protein n=1 Tax=Pseudomonas sp. OIL-1 TaxID=2706126 RepID=UPI0013A72984|nr:ankyrin repeat domain-containing protein [Pseudomonas sp. OIL-1]QIB52352.1 hypothetical protein G3M63_15665 [Pseudomonas sp. OIL-1]